MNRDEILETARGLVSGDRDIIYGDPWDNFDRIGRLWAVVLERDEITREQVSLMLTCLKVARLVHTPGHEDSWVDMTGYSAIGGEMAARWAERLADDAAGVLAVQRTEEQATFNALPTESTRRVPYVQKGARTYWSQRPDGGEFTVWDAPFGGRQVEKGTLEPLEKCPSLGTRHHHHTLPDADGTFIQDAYWVGECPRPTQGPYACPDEV